MKLQSATRLYLPISYINLIYFAITSTIISTSNIEGKLDGNMSQKLQHRSSNLHRKALSSHSRSICNSFFLPAMSVRNGGKVLIDVAFEIQTKRAGTCEKNGASLCGKHLYVKCKQGLRLRLQKSYQFVVTYGVFI